MFWSSLVLGILLLLCLVSTEVSEDLVPEVPGYIDSKNRVFSGYLQTSSSTRKLHYVFVQADQNVKNSLPVTLWLNGGPGCSSMIGFLQQIGPYYLEEGKPYSEGDSLTPNPHSWSKISNLLFIQSPAGVGFSFSNDKSFEYNDETTLQDNFDALRYFFSKYPQYSNNDFRIAGESYAGKYVPDLAVRIDQKNKQGETKINLVGIMIGNGVMSFQDGELEKSQIEYLLDHEFIDPELVNYYSRSCSGDPQSAGCKYFKATLRENIDEINPYSVYGYCFYNSSFKIHPNAPFLTQQNILSQIAATKNTPDKSYQRGDSCAYFDGLYHYFNIHAKQFHADGRLWNGPCANNITSLYVPDIEGSISQYKHLIAQNNTYSIILYNGDWDSIVPYTDTLKNLQKKLFLNEPNLHTPFFVDDQHAGFYQLFGPVTFITVKGGSHQVPQSKRAAAYFIYHSAISNSYLSSSQSIQGSKQLEKQL